MKARIRTTHVFVLDFSVRGSTLIGVAFFHPIDKVSQSTAYRNGKEEAQQVWVEGVSGSTSSSS